MTGMRYRREIDGLRAVAVLPVILFHTGLEALSGGFVGVDVFFVISGYLITGIILADLEDKRFSLLHFYERRARRILPALFTVILASLPAAWVLLPPVYLKDFAQSVVSVAVFSSNILFWQESGYFNTAAELKPLLHTWSLAVEEQYYLVFPLFLIVVWRMGRLATGVAMVALGLGGFLLADWLVGSQPAAAFFLLPTRGWELLSGALLAVVLPVRPVAGLARGLREAAGGLGLALVAYAVATYDHTTPFPSRYTLLPVVGTMLLIAFATAESAVGRILGHRSLVGIGLISYSAYLWHQVLFAFAKQSGATARGHGVLIGLVGATIGLAYVSWRWVEQPFRDRSRISGQRVLAAASAGSFLFLGVGVYGHRANGFPGRLADDRATFLDQFENSIPAWRYFERVDLLTEFRENCNFFDLDRYRRGASSTVPRATIGSECHVRDPTKPRAVLLWGDSHATHLYPGLQASLPSAWQILQVTSSGCEPSLTANPDRQSPYCTYSNSFAWQTLLDTRPDVLVLAQAGSHDSRSMMSMAAAARRAGVKRVVLVGPTPHWLPDLPSVVAYQLWGSVPRYTWAGLDQDVIRDDQALKQALGREDGIEYVSVFETLCGDMGCLVYTGDDLVAGLTSPDYGHLTAVSSRLFAERALAAAVQGLDHGAH